jgi:hypothetical protein
MYLTEIGWEDMDWIQAAQDKDRWQPLVKTVMDTRIPFFDQLSNYQLQRPCTLESATSQFGKMPFSAGLRTAKSFDPNYNIRENISE